MRQAEDMLGKSKNSTLNSVDLPREREPETLSPLSDADASNQVWVENVLPPGQKCTYTVMMGCKSRANVLKLIQGIHPKTKLIRLDQGANLGLVSQKCIPKISSEIHPKIN